VLGVTLGDAAEATVLNAHPGTAQPALDTATSPALLVEIHWEGFESGV
jgi:hypothetical protein